MGNGTKFYKYLKELLQSYFEEEKDSLDIYKGFNSWTEVITKTAKNGSSSDVSLIDQALLKVFEDSKLANEYYRIDNCVYRYIEKGYDRNFKETGIRIHKWELLAAVEHENDWTDWSDELVKLTYINCPLRVVISYGNYDDKYRKAIQTANTIAKEIKISDYISSEQEFLLVFGPRSKNLKKNNEEIASKFIAFKWNGKLFEELK